MVAGNKIKYYLIALLAVFFWATAFVGIRYVANDFSAGPIALLRYAIASLVMLFAYIYYPQKVKPNLIELAAMMGLGVFGFTIYNILLNQGERTVSAALAGFIVGQMPVIISLVAVLFFKEKIRLLGIIGFFVSILGLFLIVIAENQRGKFNFGLIYILIATISSSVYVILQKPLLKKFHPIEIVSYLIWGGTIVLLLYLPSLISEIKLAPLDVLFTIIYMGIFPGALAYLLWSYALTYLPLSRASSFLYLSPFLTLLLSWILLNEVPLAMAIIGGVVAIAGAYIIAKNAYEKIIIDS
mgnify:CR=1 FL=1